MSGVYTVRVTQSGTITIPFTPAGIVWENLSPNYVFVNVTGPSQPDRNTAGITLLPFTKGARLLPGNQQIGVKVEYIGGPLQITEDVLSSIVLTFYDTPPTLFETSIDGIDITTINASGSEQLSIAGSGGTHTFLAASANQRILMMSMTVGSASGELRLLAQGYQFFNIEPGNLLLNLSWQPYGYLFPANSDDFIIRNENVAASQPVSCAFVARMFTFQ